MPVVSTPTGPPLGPPSAAHEPHEHVAHGLRRPDPFHWMRRLDAPVLDHLAAEREWYDVASGHLGPLVQSLRAEMADRVPATDSSVSWPQHGYSYYTVLPAGREYVQLLRRRHG
ncbi:MAG: oligopeptidase, partial [Nocardioidaceae bacterium]|nr:oligopeptidase [Nocardioidaceae bacterium]